MTDQDVRDFLQRMVAEEPVPSLDPEHLARRARRRAARTVVVGAVGVAAAVAVLFAGASQLREESRRIPANPPDEAPVDLGSVMRENGEVLRFTGLLPDGTLGSPGDLVAVDPRTGEERVLLEDLDGVYLARWSADGRWLAYETDATDGVGRDLWVAGGSQAPRVVATGGNPIAGVPELEQLAWMWSPTGAALATIEHSETLRTIDVATGETTDLGGSVADLLQPTGASEGRVRWAWSQDRTRLLFASSWGTREGSLYSVDTRSGERSLLAVLPGFIERIRWSPDGAHIAVQTREESARTFDPARLYVMDADGSNIRSVTDDSNSLPFAWSPDGTRLAFGSEAERGLRIQVATTDGAAPAQIGTIPNHCSRTSWGGVWECFVTWSPDGTQVAWRTGGQSQTRVAVFDAAGAGEAGPLDELTFLDWDGGWYAYYLAT